MYNAYFGFTEKPFTIAPNPKYLLMSRQHQEALAHMLFSVQGEGGIALLTGEVGTGKTTICRKLLQQLPEKTEVAFIMNPNLTTLELLAAIGDELHIAYPTPISIKALTDAINTHLLHQHSQGIHTVLVIDEAQTMDAHVLEQLRLLTNLETDEKKLLQIMLFGQPELAEKLQRHELRQFAQRITARYHLTPLNKQETAAYVTHRLHVAGAAENTIFSTRVMAKLFEYSRGIPRLINLICDRALLGAYSREAKQVSVKMLRQATWEVGGQMPAPQHTWHWMYPSALVLAISVLLILYWSLLPMVDGLHIGLPAQQTILAPEKPEAQKPAMALASMPEHMTVASNDVVIQEVATQQSLIQNALIQQAAPAIPLLTSQDAAFVAVFSAWAMDYQPERDGEACAFARLHQLQCLRQRGDIASLRSLARPAVLTVSDALGQPAYVALTALSGTDAVLAASAQTVRIHLAVLALQSHNDFTVLWKAPVGYEAPVRPGHTGALVQLLADACTKAQGQHWIGGPRTTYDSGLKEQIKSFQREQGLNPDGVAGPITWIRLNQKTGVPAPSLVWVEPMDVVSRP